MPKCVFFGIYNGGLFSADKKRLCPLPSCCRNQSEKLHNQMPPFLCRTEKFQKISKLFSKKGVHLPQFLSCYYRGVFTLNQKGQSDLTNRPVRTEPMRSTPQQFSLYRTSEKRLFPDIPKKNSLLFGKIYDIIER